MRTLYKIWKYAYIVAILTEACYGQTAIRPQQPGTATQPQAATRAAPLSLADRLQVKIVVAPRAFVEKYLTYQVQGHAPSVDQLKAYAPLLADEYSLYTAEFMKAADVKSIVLAADLTLSSAEWRDQRRYALPAMEKGVLYLDCTALSAGGSEYARIVMHHELFHMIDFMMNTLSQDDAWGNLNVAGFHYGTGGASALKNVKINDKVEGFPGFFTWYGTTGPEEDKAELWAHLLVHPDMVAKQSKTDKVMTSKVALIKARIGKFQSDFDETFWQRVVVHSTTAAKH